MIAAWRQPGLSINVYCRDRKLTRSNFDQRHRFADPASWL
jgi:hypothetical protein